MNEFFISDADLAPLKGQVVVCTGSASGIGLATCKMLTEQLGAYVVGGDLFEPREPVNSENFTYVKTNVTKWDELKNLFKTAVDKYGKVDHVFANAGMVFPMPRSRRFKRNNSRYKACLRRSPLLRRATRTASRGRRTTTYTPSTSSPLQTLSSLVSTGCKRTPTAAASS